MCPVCRRPIAQQRMGRPRVYCSDSCRSSASAARHRAEVARAAATLSAMTERLATLEAHREPGV